MGEVPVLQQQAYNHYTTYQAKYDELSGQAKIAKLSPHITNWLCTVAAGRRQTATATARSTAPDAEGAAKPAKRMRSQAGTIQGQSSTNYTAIPEGTFSECNNAGHLEQS